jgi:2',3'-cyclic-nucleotide 2'-phosphodiesterase (5'-nucleotidase family)
MPGKPSFFVLLLAFAVTTLDMAASPAAAQAPVPPATMPEITLTILHDNDLHGHLFPFAYTEVGRGNVEKLGVGGAARRATLVGRLRASIRNPNILIDSGDTFTRGPLTTTYEGVPDIEAMNAVGYELAALGNNEFKARDGADAGDAAGAQAALLRVVKRSRFAWVCANARDQKGAMLEGVQPYVVRVFDGVRVGFLGLTAPRSASYPQTKGWTISDPIAAAKEWIPKARADCDVLIAVTHIGVDLDKQLAAQTTGLDAIVGGDSHTFLYQAVDVKNADGSATVPIVQDGEFGVNLGRFDLDLARDPSTGAWRLKSYRYALLPVNAAVPQSDAVNAVLAPYLQPFLQVVGHLPGIAATPQLRGHQTTQIVVDALRTQTGSDLALSPLGDGFYEVFRHADVTRYDVFAVLPFHDDAVTASLTGAQVQALLRSQPTTVASGDTTHLDATKTYRVAFVDYTASSDYKLPADQSQQTGRDVRDLVISYLKNMSDKM